MSSEHADLDKLALSLGKNARKAARELAGLTSGQKNAALLAAAAALRDSRELIKAQNAIDLKAGREASLSAALLDRLALTDSRIDSMAAGLEQVAGLTDPVGEIITGWRRPNGLLIEKVRVPLGVVLMIYESRPNVTADAAALTLKSGNAVILRGGKEAAHSNQAIAGILTRALAAEGLGEAAVQMVDTADRALVGKLLSLSAYIDVVIPRGLSLIHI